MVEITEINCPICDKGKIKIIETHGYGSVRKGFVGRNIPIYHNSSTEILNDCSECNATIKEIKKRLC